MDAFSALAGAAGLLDVCFKVARYLKSVEESAGKVEEEIANMSHDISSLVSVYQSLEEVWLSHKNDLPGTVKADAAYADNLWRDVSTNLKDCRGTVSKLENLLEAIVGRHGPKVTSKLDGIKKQLRKQSKEGDLDQIRHRLATSQASLQMLLTALSLLYTRGSYESTGLSLNHLSEKLDDVQQLGFTLRYQLASLRPRLNSSDSSNLHSSINSAAAVVSLLSLNRHFHIPQTLSSIFTGRERLLRKLKNDLESSSLVERSRVQRRFVIYGLGGSGKTQFCCKFAQDNRENFWGIFWMDASSQESANHTLSRIAKIGGVEPNERAAKNWLSNLEHPWLLIIDNADDPTITVEEYIPKGERGFILVTTRNPSNKVYGTFGSRFYAFERLETDDASDLLLKAADQPSPWSLPTRDSAAHIAETLGFLPLALIHAGKAIMDGLCSLTNYLDFYRRSWERIRRSRSISGFREDRNANMNVYSTYEIIYTGLEDKDTEISRDAVELLKTFSFLYRENIEVQMLVAAARNPRLEQEQQIRERENSAMAFSTKQKRKSWTKLLREWSFVVLEPILRDRSRPVLPTVLQDVDEVAPFDVDRLRTALALLAQLGLITYHERSDSYSMHPLVHTWVRERPRTSTAEQAVWCQAAITTLACCILFRPPPTAADSDERLRRDILPHVNHVRKCQGEIRVRIAENLKTRKRPWLVSWNVSLPAFGRNEARECAKFSLVYSQCGKWDEAVELQLQVKDFLCKNLGPEHPLSIDIMLLLSFTYMQQFRNIKAAELQRQVLEACRNSLGPDHPKTLKAMDTLGANCAYRGQFSEARKLHEEAIERMTKFLGPDHEDTLLAVDNLGKVMSRYFFFEKAKDLHLKAMNGMKKTLGPTHLSTLSAMENVAVTYLEIGGELLERAHELMELVLHERKKKLGKEQPYTLMAIAILARIKAALNQTEEAEDLLRTTLHIAERNLGENHGGTLLGRVWLSHVLVHQKRYIEAEVILARVVQRQRYENSAREDGEHTDRIQALWYLLKCYQLQGKIEDAIRIGDELFDAVRTIGGEGLGTEHVFAKLLADKQEELLTARAMSAAE